MTVEIASSNPFTTALDATSGAIEADPKAASARFRASGSSTGPVTTTITLGRHTIHTDEPAALGGQDGAPNPVEYALAALLSCQSVSYRVWAAKLGIEIDDIDISIDGDLDLRGFFGLEDSVRPGFGDIAVTVDVRGPESAERYADLHEVVEAHCPVLDLFVNPTPVRSTLRVG